MLIAKRTDASNHILDFFTWAMLSLFCTRLFLKIFNNPTIGRGDWHIAHVLWGGLFMLFGILISLVFHGKTATKYTTIFAGIGWGLFIDEIGKYITRDNNYWFRPAIIFIYISFVLLFFLYRILEKKSPKNRLSLWYALLEDSQELIHDDLESQEKKELLSKIEKFKKISPSSEEEKILSDLKALVIKTPALKDKYQFSVSKFIATSLKVTYNRIFKKKLFLYGSITYSFWYILDKMVDTIRLFFNSDKLSLLQNYYSHYDFFSQTEVYMISLKFVVESIVAVFFTIGLVNWLNKKTIKGIRYYQWGLLINIFIGSLFKFYFEQFSGVFSLVLALVVWTWLDNYRRELSLSIHRHS